MNTLPKLHGLFHDPYGLEHPYEQAPTERFPREPVADQPVALGVATSPPGAAEVVWADWTVEGTSEGGRAEAHHTEDRDGYGYWCIPLPAFRSGQRITYRVQARQGDWQLSSETFSFVVAGWYSIEDVVRYHLGADYVELECASADPVLRPRVAIAFRAPHLLHIRLMTKNPAEIGQRDRKPRGQVSLGTETVISLQYRVLEETDGHILIATEHVRITIHRHPFRLEIAGADGSSLLSEAMPLAWLISEYHQALRLRQAFASPPDEGFYGFGERYNALNQRGNELDIRVFEQYKNQGSYTYLPVPFFLSSRGYGLYLATSRPVAYDLAASRPEQWSVDAEVGSDGSLDYYLILGDPKQIINTFADLAGRPALPPAWTFGPWMSGNEWNSQAAVTEQVRKTIEYRIPATVLVIEAWSDEATFYIWNDAQYTPKPADEPFTYRDFTFPPEGRWPDPKGMIEELHRLGIRLLLWQIPVMKKSDTPHPQHDVDEQYMAEKGYCVHEADSQPYRVRPFWFHDGLVLDFTNSTAVQWWLSKRAYLLEELGIDGFKTDGGEHLWGRDLHFADGRRGDELWNLYPNLYVGAYHEFARERRKGDAITFSRAGFTGAQAYPCHWAGDENSTWEAFRASILAGLNAGLSGIPFWGWDLAGFSGEIPSAELYLRAAAMAAFCPIMQYHSEYNEHQKPCRDRTPWNIAERTGEPKVIEIYRKFAQLRMQLLPYIEAEAAHCVATGEPLMRALILDWPEDPITWEITDQYSFGRALLVAPVVDPGITERRLYLPAGEWEDFWSGAQFSGRQWITRSAPLDVIPVFRRRDVARPT